jgi:PAS domain S-box-containing protein
LLAGLTDYAIVAVFAIAGASPFVLIAATICFGFALLLDAVYRKRFTIGTVSVVIGFALLAAVLQAPYAMRDHETKRRESIQEISRRIEAQSDAWKISVLEGAVAEVADRGGLAEVLAGGHSGLDDFALELWANSILSGAGVVSGIHVLDRGHEVMGRFSLEDIGDVPEIEGAIRNAKFSGKPVTVLTRGAFAGSDIDLYVGVIPVFDGEVYLGSIVISIPFAYGDLRSMAGLRSSFLEAFALGDTYGDLWEGDYSASLLSGGRIVSTTAKDFEVGKSIAALEGLDAAEPAWIEHKVAGTRYASYYVPPGNRSESLLLSLRMPTASDRAVHIMGLLIGNLLIALFIIIILGLAGGARRAVRASRGRAPGRMRWSFATKLAIAFVLIAIVPTLILGTASRRFLRARLREIMESKAEEGLNLSKLALERLLGGEAVRLARNPILIDELTEEPSILGMLISHDVSSAVFNSSGAPLATYGEPYVPPAVLSSVLREGRSHSFFSVEDGLYAKSAVPVRDVISPGNVRGCAFVSRRIDDALAYQLSGELGRDVSFFGSSTVAASSKREVFVSELMATKISPDAYLECFVSGRELHFTWERIGGIDVVIGFSPLRGFDGTTVGAISIPVLFRQDDVGRRIEWTSTAISYLLVIVIGSMFILGLILARRISRPIRDLIRGTLRIGSGDLRFTIPKSGDDEIGDLVSSFNKMTGALSKSRKALSERKQYIETIISNVGAGIISTDWKGRIDTFNSAAEKLLGIKGRNARGRDAGKLLKKIGAASLAAVLDEVEGEEGLTRKEVNLTQASGRMMTLRAVASVIKGPRGRGMGKVIVFEDVTELIRSKQLIAWSEMARQVAHEIKNPLTPMKLSAQQLLQSHRDRAGDFDRVLEDSVATIIEQIESLRRIAVEFSQFSRMPERKIEISDLNRILEECLAQYERTMGSMIEIKKQLDSSIPRLKLDRDEMKRVFLNVIENAVQAMPDGGNLEVRSGRQGTGSGRGGYRLSVTSRDVHADPLRDYVEVSFTDTGGGIATRDSKRLFEPNFSTKTHGSGLGLAISKGIVDGYGGEIVVESTPGVGTCVRIRIPLPERPIRRGRPRRRDSRRSRRPRSR